MQHTQALRKALAILLIAGTAAAATYTHPKNGYRLTYPDAWSARANFVGADLAITVPGTPDAPSLITVVTQELPAGMTLAAYTRATTEFLPQALQNFKLDSSKAVRIHGTAARDLVFTGTRSGNSVYGHVILLVRGQTGYTVSYLGALPANDESKRAIDAVLTSFKLQR